MPTKNIDDLPIFQLLRKIKDEEARKETMLLIDYLRVRRIGDLRRYSREDLTHKIEVSAPTTEQLEKALNQFGEGVTFSTRSYIQINLERAPEAPPRENRDYSVVDPEDGKSLLVNNQRIELSTRKNALSKDKITQIYLRFKVGDEPAAIAKDIGISAQTVVSYLERAQVYVRPRRPGTVLPAAPAQHQPATGAPPPSLYQELLEQLR